MKSAETPIRKVETLVHETVIFLYHTSLVRVYDETTSIQDSRSYLATLVL